MATASVETTRAEQYGEHLEAVVASGTTELAFWPLTTCGFG